MPATKISTIQLTGADMFVRSRTAPAEERGSTIKSQREQSSQWGRKILERSFILFDSCGLVILNIIYTKFSTLGKKANSNNV